MSAEHTAARTAAIHNNGVAKADSHLSELPSSLRESSTPVPAWRLEFPVEMARDNDVTRRNFIKFLGLTSLAFVVGQVWIFVQNWRRRRRGPSPRRAIAQLDQLPVGGAMTFSYPGEHDACLLIRPSEQSLLAYDQRCTHLSCSVVPDVEAGCLRCPCHKGLFDLSTGRPIAGPPRRPLARIQLQVLDGVVFATGVELRTV